MTRKLGLGLIYITSIVTANWLSAHFGLIPIGLGLLVSAGTFAAGVALLTRNLGQDALGRPIIFTLMLAGIGLSWWLATPALAIASATAFALSELTDMTVYTWLRRRGRSRALMAAALAGALIDTLVFLSLAGFPVTVNSVTGQMLVKVGISGLVAALIRFAPRRTVTA